ncbi:MAG: hypothetical protein LBV73_12695 [Paraburkholderia sp.]|jgi:hypothetical protein|nr:hypothetical protein [Paraburkholderia sp.]
MEIHFFIDRWIGLRGLASVKMGAVGDFLPSSADFPMTRTSRSVSIAPEHDASALSKAQKTFNSLIAKIGKRRKRLRDWETATPAFQKRYVDELLPLEKTSAALRTRMVHCLDQAYECLTKTECRKVALVIVDLAGDLIGEDENEGKALKAIYDKYSPTSYDSEVATEVVGMKSMLEAMFGVDLGDDEDLNSPEDLLQRAETHFQDAQAQWESENAQRDARSGRHHPGSRPPKRTHRSSRQS